MLASACAVIALIDPRGATGDPGYQIVLRSREAHAAPVDGRTSQTGGGSVIVEQPSPNTVTVRMEGTAAAGSTFHCSRAGIDFSLLQAFDVVPTRPGVRPPRIGMMGRVVGTLTVTHAEHAPRATGSASQGPATASLWCDDESVLELEVPASAVDCGNKLWVNHQSGPCEAPIEVGDYRLSADFRVAARQGKSVWNRQYAVADFDRAPQLDPFWADGLKTFRAAPREQFGFLLVLRVVEGPEVAVAVE
jgi:hypothetical protein